MFLGGLYKRTMPVVRLYQLEEVEQSVLRAVGCLLGDNDSDLSLSDMLMEYCYYVGIGERGLNVTFLIITKRILAYNTYSFNCLTFK